MRNRLAIDGDPKRLQDRWVEDVRDLDNHGTRAAVVGQVNLGGCRIADPAEVGLILGLLATEPTGASNRLAEAQVADYTSIADPDGGVSGQPADSSRRSARPTKSQRWSPPRAASRL